MRRAAGVSEVPSLQGGTMDSWRLLRLAMREVGQPLWKSWTLTLGLALGVCTWILLQGFTQGTGQLLRDKIAGSLPNRLRVSPATTAIGPLSLSSHMDDDTVKACRAIPGVTAVFRQAHCPEPVHLTATYLGQSMQTDLVLDGVDPGQVAAQVNGGYRFEDLPPGSSDDVPVMLPQSVLDLVNAGIASHTSLPTLSEQALIGRHFDLTVGSSTFKPGQGHTFRCVIVGVTDQLGVSGPAVPLEWLRKNSRYPLTYSTLMLEMEPGVGQEKLMLDLQKLGLRAPDNQTLEEISTLTRGLSALAALFSLAILLVAGVSVFSGIALQVREERMTIGLLRALGASQQTIGRVYLLRSALLGLVGSVSGVVAGLCLGWTCATLIHHFMPISLTQPDRLFSTTARQILIPCALGVLTSVVAGWRPAQTAAAFRPAAILRGD